MDQTEAQMAYKHFDRKSKLISAALVAAGVICLLFFLICERLDSLVGLLVSIAALAIWLIALCVIATRLNETRLRLYQQAYGPDEHTTHTGLFRDLLEEFERNRFESMTDAKVLFSEAHGSTIELELCRSTRTCHIVIDPGAVFMVIEEESAAPIEIELPLADFTDTGEVFTAIHSFVERP